ncbi:hypothetical protein [Oleidesulfovibrio alaskensis]|jgi:hypothetical protein|uniref:hypothetical protein n=1 Tax=Oleidesulfovibrio alaskensis TaxID=58180 RepID=UPI0002D89A4B|nr:hypothetical protein [Oleidesulfovibrio alaskensis]MBG0773056.1 hypothetical protein [Oleidesulfovibrio alaskensis]MBL3583525.1 hypothetical protein [Oleidesulfovibrio alaskensis]MBL3587941.1 hypothetical protein [bacterium]
MITLRKSRLAAGTHCARQVNAAFYIITMLLATGHGIGYSRALMMFSSLFTSSDRMLFND